MRVTFVPLVIRRAASVLLLAGFASSASTVQFQDAHADATNKTASGGGNIHRPLGMRGSVGNASNALDLADILQPGDDLNSERVYLIEFEEPPAAARLRQLGNSSSRRPPSQRGKSGKVLRAGQIDFSGAEAISYLSYLSNRQAGYLDAIAARTGRRDVKFVYRYAFNGVAMTMTPADAIRVAGLAGVKRVLADRTFELDTDRGPEFIGAAEIWAGNAPGGISAQGEGMVIGIIDTGVNGPNPIRAHAGHVAFAEVGGDGYVHVNPYPGYLGECASEPGLCNDKLVGRYSYVNDSRTPPGDPPSQDTDGHGSHVMSIAGGNVLFDVPMPDVEGNPSGYRIERISGVAPHANLISYKVCYFGYCELVAIIAAVDQAIQDGVHVLNHSISGGGGDAWFDPVAKAFLNAHSAGIFIATSAGNSGPHPYSADEGTNAPWTVSVAALSHDRAFSLKPLHLTGGSSQPPSGILGRGVTGSYTGPIVYAKDFPTANGSPNDTEPEQCLAPFPAGTWTRGEIVVCDRGTFWDSWKAAHVRQGGAGGFVIANTADEALADERHVLPAINIDRTNRARLLAWLASGDDHRATIASAGPVEPDADAGDILASFSSRGPSFQGYLVPNVAAPGLAVLAAGADLNPDMSAGSEFYRPAAPKQYGVLSGTSMSSPHVAGAAALLMQLHPEWTIAELQSAMVTTARPSVRLHDGANAGAIDMGGGRLQLTEATKAPLLLGEDVANFLHADPGLGGVPARLNLAGISNRCLTGCSWERTLTATVPGTWEISTSGDAFSVQPRRFSLKAGESQTLEIWTDVSGLPRNRFVDGRIVLTPGDPSLPVQALPAAAYVVSAQLPEVISITAFSDSGAWQVQGIETIAITEFHARTVGLDRAVQATHDVDRDTTPNSPFDDTTDGVSVDFVSVPAGTTRLVAEIVRASPHDLRLYVGIDLNGDGMATEDEVVCSSAPRFDDVCDLTVPQLASSLTWWALVQNLYEDSQPGIYDPFTVAITVVGEEDDGNLRIVGPSGYVPELERFDIQAIWDFDLDIGDIYYGWVHLGSSPSSPGDIVTLPVRLECPQASGTPHLGGVCGNRWPFFISSPLTAAAVGARYEHSVEAVDVDAGDSLEYSAELLPDWLSLASDGDAGARLSGTPEPRHMGEHAVAVRVTDSAGDSRTQEFAITVTDETPPVITLIGPAVMTLDAGDEFIDPGATAWDDVDGDLSAQIVANGYVDVMRPGEWGVFYYVSDSAGHAADPVYRAVVVKSVPASGGGGAAPSGGGGGGAIDAWLLATLILSMTALRRRLRLIRMTYDTGVEAGIVPAFVQSRNRPDGSEAE